MTTGVTRRQAVLTGLLLGALAPALIAQPAPPAPPASGPGGAEYAHAASVENGPYWAAGYESNNAYRYWIYEPAEPAPARAPVVLFLHGWLAYRPTEYGTWMLHLVRKGHTVVWVQYDAAVFNTWAWTNAAATTWIDALARLENEPGHVKPERDGAGQPKTAILGHSAGGILGPILAAKATRWWWWKLPKPQAIFSISAAGYGLIPGEDYSRIAPETKVLMVVGESDQFACAATAAPIWEEMTGIPDANKDFLIVRTDPRGSPAQIANHFYPNNTGTGDVAAIDGRDYWITLRLSAALLNCAFRGNDCNVALGNGSPPQVEMGEWSDGAARLPLTWAPNPSSPPLVCNTYGL